MMAQARQKSLMGIHGFLGTKIGAGPGGRFAGRQRVGEIVGKKWRGIANVLSTGIAAVGVLLANGCGGKGATNVVTVSISSSSGIILILGQSTTLNATVSGTGNTKVTWSNCQYTTTTTTNGKTTTSSLTDCPTDGSFGALSNTQDTGTATYTAPDPAKFQIPDQTKFPGLQIVITATSMQDKKKSGKINLTLISGITVVLTPATASVPTKEQQQFFVRLTNDLQSKGVKWLVTQNIPSTTNGVTTNYPQLPTCSPTNGTITPDANNPNVAVYQAPDTVPTAITPAQTNNSTLPQNVTVVATAAADDQEFTIGTVTIVQGGPITFNGISPPIVPQGAALWDIYLSAPNISSSTLITLTDSAGGFTTKDSTSGQIKVLFPLPTSTTSSTTTTLSSTGARVRLFESDLANAGPITVSIKDPAQTCNGVAPGTSCSATGTGTYNIIPVRPTSTASVPDDVVQGKLSQQTRIIIDGGYFGPAAVNSLATVSFNGQGLGLDNNHPSDSRHLDALINTSQINSGNPGLYALSVTRSAAPAPAVNNPSVTSMALFPDYSSTPPQVVVSGIPAGTNPSAIDIDPQLGVAVVAETGSNAVQFYSIGASSLTPIDSTGATCPAGCPITVGKVPTGVSVNRNNHTVAVVNYQDQSVTMLPIPGAPQQAAGTPFTVDISGALQGSVTPAPLPYSIGVDPDSNLAIVAYSSTSSSSSANLGFIVNLNPDSPASPNPYGCVLEHAINSSSTKVGQCLSAQVTLNNGAYPQIAMAPHGHFALVTPGGQGVGRGVDVTKPSTANVLQSSTLTAGLVTVTVDTTKCPPGVQPTSTSSTNPCPLQMVPGNAGTVLITGVKPGTAANDSLFNGDFAVTVTSSNSFTYTVPNATASDSGAGGTVFYGPPDQIFSTSATTQGVAINPVTRTAAMADANATGGSQIWLLNSLDQSVSTISFSADCTAFIPSCPSSRELLATANVAWQPFTNELVSYNPGVNQVSISDPVGHLRYAFACEPKTSPPAPIPAPLPCLTNPVGAQQQQQFQEQITLNGTGTATLAVQNGTTGSLTLFGGLAVDPVSNQAFVVMSGSGTIDVIDLGGPGTATPIKPTHITEVIVPSPTPGLGVVGGIPNATVPQATLTSTQALSGVQIFGAGFISGLQVRLDSVDITTLGGTIDKIASNGREVDVTIPSAFLSVPHHYALDVVSNNATSNPVDFLVIQSVDMSKLCTDSTGTPIANTMPTSVAVADQIANGPFSPIAVVSVSGCNSVAVLDINPTVAGQPNPNLGHLIGNPVSVGANPQGIAISQPLGLAVVANHGAGTASVLDLTPLPAGSPVQKVPDVATGTNPTGVAINDATGAAIVANTGSNTVSLINLGLLFPATGTPPITLTPVSIGGIQQPIAVAVDPDRGRNEQGIAVVTAVALSSGSAPLGALAVVEIGFATPALSTTISSGVVSGTATGIVFDPTVVTGTSHLGAFYANSSGTNTITEFNPDSGGGASVNVGINPTSLAVNPQTGAILTSNSASNTISIVDTLSNPFRTHQTIGIPGSAAFSVAIDPFTNLAIIIDQAHNRVLLFPMPN